MEYHYATERNYDMRTKQVGNEYHWMLGYADPELDPRIMAGRMIEFIDKYGKERGIDTLRVAAKTEHYTKNIDWILRMVMAHVSIPVFKMDVARYEMNRPFVPVRPKDACQCEVCKKIGYKHGLDEKDTGYYDKYTGIFMYTCKPCADRIAWLEQMWGPN